MKFEDFKAEVARVYPDVTFQFSSQHQPYNRGTPDHSVEGGYCEPSESQVEVKGVSVNLHITGLSATVRATWKREAGITHQEVIDVLRVEYPLVLTWHSTHARPETRETTQYIANGPGRTVTYTDPLGVSPVGIWAVINKSTGTSDFDPCLDIAEMLSREPQDRNYLLNKIRLLHELP